MKEAKKESEPFALREASTAWTGDAVEVLGSAREEKSVVPGTKVRDLRTPALLADLDGLENNLTRMAGFFRNQPARLRPHFKAHQVLELAYRQIRAGAAGLTCARLCQAEALIDQGFRDVLIANEIAGRDMIERYVDLSRRAPVIVAVDNPLVVAEMARAAGDRVHELNVLVDLDVRLGRCGVTPGQAALSLARLVLAKGLRFRGLMGYEGHIPLPPGAEKQRVVHDALRQLTDSKALLEDEGIPVEIVSCGGTSDYSIAASFPGVTEVQAGSYLLMDTWYEPFAHEFRPTLTVLATVISKPSGKRLVADAGVKAIDTENGLPGIKGIPGLRVKTLHVEHALLEIEGAPVPLEVGDTLEFWVNCLEPTVALHSCIYGVRNGEVEEVFQIVH
ncbi:MAG TPA: alanine racemase [Terriglobia bacterium]|nr:alanine racemase [Terriglobia bacterium]